MESLVMFAPGSEPTKKAQGSAPLESKSSLNEFSFSTVTNGTFNWAGFEAWKTQNSYVPKDTSEAIRYTLHYFKDVGVNLVRHLPTHTNFGLVYLLLYCHFIDRGCIPAQPAALSFSCPNKQSELKQTYTFVQQYGGVFGLIAAMKLFDLYISTNSFDLAQAIQASIKSTFGSDNDWESEGVTQQLTLLCDPTGANADPNTVATLRAHLKQARNYVVTQEVVKLAARAATGTASKGFIPSRSTATAVSRDGSMSGSPLSASPDTTSPTVSPPSSPPRRPSTGRQIPVY